jgi:O-antigen/teichoic acid export membrane protein
LNKQNTSSFYRNVAVLISGTVIAQAIPFLTMPFLQKYFYSPAQFALFFAFMRFSDLFMTIANLKLELGLVLQKKKDKQEALTAIAIKTLSIVTIFSLLAVCLFRHAIAKFYGYPEIANYLMFIPLVIFCFGLYQIMYYSLNSMGKFKAMANSKVSQTASSESFKLLGGFLQLGTVGLVLGRVIGPVVAMFYSLWRVRPNFKSIFSHSKEARKSMWKSNKDFVLFSTPSVFVKSLINLIVLDMILRKFGAQAAGNFGASMMYIGALLGVLSSSFGQVYFNSISSIESKSRLLQNYLHWVKRLSFISLSILILVFAIPKSWVIILLGKEWGMLLPITQIMAVFLSIQFISGSLSFIYIRLKKQKTMLGLDVLQLLISTTGLYLGFYFYSDLLPTLWFYSIAQALFYLIAIFAAIHFIKSSDLQE